MPISLLFSGIFLFIELFEFRFALFQAAPGNNERFGFRFLLLAGDDAFQLRIELDDPREERTFCQFIENRREHQPAHGVAGHARLRAGKHVWNQFPVIQHQIAQFTAAAVFVMLIAFERGKNRCRANPGSANRAIRPARSLQSQIEHFARDRVFANPALQIRAQLSLLSGVGKDPRNLCDCARMIAIASVATRARSTASLALPAWLRARAFLWLTAASAGSRSGAASSSAINCGERQRRVRCLELRAMREQIIARHHQLEGKTLD